MCDCITATEKAIKEVTGDPAASVETSIIYKNNTLYGFPQLNATYRKKKKDGTISSRPERYTIIPNYCPFCGEQYEFAKQREDAQTSTNE